MQEKKQYFYEINIARGIALLFVILGHSFFDLTQPGSKKLYIIIYSFHMGLFFILSGFVSAKKLLAGDYKLKNELGNKCIRLVIPYLIFSMASLVLKLIFAEYANNPFDISEFYKIFIGISPNGGLWFLWTLFIISVIFMLIGKLKLRIAGYIIFPVALYIVSLFVDTGSYSNIFKYSILYAVGIFTYKYYGALKKYIFKAPVALAALLLFCLLFVFRIKRDYFITCLLASTVILTISLFISSEKCKNSAIFKVFNELGSYSYDIYLISYFVQIPIRVIFTNIIKLPYTLVCCLMLIFGIAVSYVISKFILRKIPIANLLLLGNKRRKE